MRVNDLMANFNMPATLDSLHDGALRLNRVGAPARLMESAHNVYYAVSVLANHEGDTADNIVSDLINRTMRAAAAFDGAVGNLGETGGGDQHNKIMAAAREYSEHLGVVTGLFVVGGEKVNV